MAEHDFAGALVALTDWLKDATVPALRRAVSGANKIELFAFAAQEADAADLYSVVRPFTGASDDTRPAGAMSCQIFTVGPEIGGDKAVMQRAQALHGRLLDSRKLPARNVTAGAFVFYGFTALRGPGLVGRRDGKIEYASNFDALFRPA